MREKQHRARKEKSTLENPICRNTGAQKGQTGTVETVRRNGRISERAEAEVQSVDRFTTIDKEDTPHKDHKTGQNSGKDKGRIVNHPHDMIIGIVHLSDQSTEQTTETRTTVIDIEALEGITEQTRDTRTTVIGTRALEDTTAIIIAKVTTATFQDGTAEPDITTLADAMDTNGVIPTTTEASRRKTEIEETLKP
jgi:hypothetical protein